MIRQKDSPIRLWAIQVAIWSPVVALFVYFVGGLIPALSHPMQTGTLPLALFRAYSHTCHQIPERSFFLDNTQFGFCARCTGFYGGLALASLFVVVTSRTRQITLPWLLVLCAPILVDVAFDLSSHYSIANELRFATGLLGAISVTLFVYPRFLKAASNSLAPDRDTT